MKDIKYLTEEELVQIAIQENNAILEQQKEEAKQKEENEKGSKYKYALEGAEIKKAAFKKKIG